MPVCVRVCIYIHMHSCVCVCVHACACLCVYLCVHMCARVCMCLCACTYRDQKSMSSALLLSLASFETGFLPEPGARCFGWIG